MVKKVQPKPVAVQPTAQLPPRQPMATQRPKFKSGISIDGIARLIAGRLDRDQTFARVIATHVYESQEQFPLLTFMERWKDDTVKCEAWFVLAVIRSYRELVEQRGPRPGDSAS